MDTLNFSSEDCLSAQGGHLFIDERNVSELVEEFGSPLFVISESQLRRNLRRFRDSFAEHWTDGPIDILPAFKANTCLATRQVLSAEGAGADVYSEGELHGVLRSGIDPQRVSVNGGGKSDVHLRACIEAGVRITVEDIDEIDRIERIAGERDRRASIRLRVKPTLSSLWRATDFSPTLVPIDLAVQVYKSGIPQEFLPELGRRALSMKHVDLVGLHLHVGRHHPSLWYWEGVMKRYGEMIGDLCKTWGGWRPSEIDIGGGMASPRDPHNRLIPRSEYMTGYVGFPILTTLRVLGERGYHAAVRKLLTSIGGHGVQRASAPTIEEYAGAIVPVLRKELLLGGIDTRGVRLQVEPGRALYGDAGIHLARVKAVKRQRKPLPLAWVLTDTTEFFLAGGVLEYNRHKFVVANRVAEPRTMTAEIVGHSCYGDRIVPGARLPSVQSGDVIAFLDTGAYQETSASNFNALPRPGTVMVSGDSVDLIRRAEEIEDVFRRDTIPPRLSSGCNDSTTALAEST